jgi:hypothetical protein
MDPPDTAASFTPHAGIDRVASVFAGLVNELCAFRIVMAPALFEALDPLLRDAIQRARIETAASRGAVERVEAIRRRIAELVPSRSRSAPLTQAIELRLTLLEDSLRELAGTGLPSAPAQQESPQLTKPLFPRWDSDTRTLYFGEMLVKRYGRHPAPNQKKVLAAFQEAGWARSIPSPVQEHQLRDTLRGLKNSLGKRSPIRFTGDGESARILWTETTLRKRLAT